MEPDVDKRKKRNLENMPHHFKLLYFKVNVLEIYVSMLHRYNRFVVDRVLDNTYLSFWSAWKGWICWVFSVLSLEGFFYLSLLQEKDCSKIPVDLSLSSGWPPSNKFILSRGNSIICWFDIIIRYRGFTWTGTVRNWTWCPFTFDKMFNPA